MNANKYMNKLGLKLSASVNLVTNGTHQYVVMFDDDYESLPSYNTKNKGR